MRGQSSNVYRLKSFYLTTMQSTVMKVPMLLKITDYSFRS